MRPLEATAAWLDELPADEEVVRAILAAGVWRFAFTPRSSKNAKVRYNTNTVVTAKAWEVNAEVSAEADVTNFEGGTQTGPDGTNIVIEQKLACALRMSFTIELDADSAANLYDAGIKPGNSVLPLNLFLNDVLGPSWLFNTPFFKTVPMKANIKEALTHRITGEGSAKFSYPTGTF